MRVFGSGVMVRSAAGIPEWWDLPAEWAHLDQSLTWPRPRRTSMCCQWGIFPAFRVWPVWSGLLSSQFALWLCECLPVRMLLFLVSIVSLSKHMIFESLNFNVLLIYIVIFYNWCQKADLQSPGPSQEWQKPEETPKLGGRNLWRIQDSGRG